MTIVGAFLGSGVEIVPAGKALIKLQVLTSDRQTMGGAIFTISGGGSVVTETADASGRAETLVDSGYTYTVSLNYSSQNVNNTSFDRINVRAFPVRYPRLCLYTRWAAGSGEFTQHTRILRSDESLLLEGRPIRFRLDDPTRSVTNIENFINLEFLAPETHWIEILLDGDLKIRLPLAITQLPPPPGAQPPGGEA